MFVELAAAQAASFPVESHSRSRILQASDIAQRDVSVHLNLIRLLRASGKEDEAAAEAALGAKIYPNLFASDRDMSKRQDAAANRNSPSSPSLMIKVLHFVVQFVPTKRMDMS
jgi:hypothetical protein